MDWMILGHFPEAQLVADVGTLLLAHADDDHLHEPAFAGAAKGDVRLDAVDHDDPVGYRPRTGRGGPGTRWQEPPISTVSMLDRMGAPTVSSVMPMPTSMSRWPSAVAPPWLPMAGKRKGSPPARRISETRSSATSGSGSDPAAAGRDGDLWSPTSPRRTSPSPAAAGPARPQRRPPAAVRRLCRTLVIRGIGSRVKAIVDRAHFCIL